MKQTRDSQRCRTCGRPAVRVVRVNARGRELSPGMYWVALAVSLFLLIGSFFGLYGPGNNHLVLALPGLILVAVSLACLILVFRMPKRFRCENAHTWE
jgi:hypothetical protein